MRCLERVARMSTQMPLQQHGVTQSGHDNVFSNSGTYNTFNTNFSIPVFMMNANDFGDVLGDFSPAARYDTGHDGGDSHYNAVDEDNAFFNISSKSKAPYKPPPSASSPTAPPHERDAEPIVDDMIQRCGSCNSISFCHALPDGSFVCLTCASRLTPAISLLADVDRGVHIHNSIVAFVCLHLDVRHDRDAITAVDGRIDVGAAANRWSSSRCQPRRCCHRARRFGRARNGLCESARTRGRTWQDHRRRNVCFEHSTIRINKARTTHKTSRSGCGVQHRLQA
jgi:hypothetical protein